MATCLRCPEETLVPASGALGESVCASCTGRLLDEPMTTSLFLDQLGLAREQLMTGAAQHERCVACNAQKLIAIDVEGIAAIVCVACGSSWLDAGALVALTNGRIAEHRPAPRKNEAVAVVSRDIVDGTALIALFARAQFRTAADARLIGTGHGLVVERATRIEAERLQQELKSGGVLTELVNTNTVTLPPLRMIADVRLAAEELLLVDDRGKRFAARYDDVVIAVMGIVRLLKAQRVPPKDLMSVQTLLGRTLGRKQPEQSADVVVERMEGPVLDVVVERERLRITSESINAKLAPGVTKETAFRAVARAVLERLPERARTSSTRGLVESAMARLDRYGPREWDCIVAWERWRALHAPSTTS